jgi:hypothetical protein
MLSPKVKMCGKKGEKDVREVCEVRVEAFLLFNQKLYEYVSHYFSS